MEASTQEILAAEQFGGITIYWQTLDRGYQSIHKMSTRRLTQLFRWLVDNEYTLCSAVVGCELEYRLGGALPSEFYTCCQLFMKKPDTRRMKIVFELIYPN